MLVFFNLSLTSAVLCFALFLFQDSVAHYTINPSISSTLDLLPFCGYSVLFVSHWHFVTTVSATSDVQGIWMTKRGQNTVG